MADQSDQKRRIARTLTQKYDMGALRALQKLETDFLEKLAAIYGCDEDDVPVELDLLHIYNQDESTRLASLQELLKDAPGDTNAIVNQLVDDMVAVSKMPTK